MLISDLEQLETLSQLDPVLGGLIPSILSLILTDQLITLSLDDRQLLSKVLSRGEPLTSTFRSDEIFGLLTATYAENNSQISRVVTLAGATDTNQFTLVFTSVSNS